MKKVKRESWMVKVKKVVNWVFGFLDEWLAFGLLLG